MERAMIVSSNSEVTETSETVLRAAGFTRIAEISAGSEARRLLGSETEPDMVIINAPLPDEFGTELAGLAAETTAASIILVCASQLADEMADRLSDYGITVLARPLNRELLLRTVKLNIASRSRMAGLKRENSDVLSRIEEMRTINRAKSALMKYLKFTEPQAHKYLEKQAMNNRQTRLEAARKIIDTYEK